MNLPASGTARREKLRPSLFKLLPSPVRMRRSWAFGPVMVLMASGAPAATDLPALWAERAKSVVAVEYVTETETERQLTASMGTVIDGEGTIILPADAVDPRAAIWQLKEFKVYVPSDPESVPAVYLGQDAFTGWHFVRAAEAIRSRVVPITAFVRDGSPDAPELAELVWGIGLRHKDEDFAPYLLQGHVALIQSLPQRVAIAQQEVAAPGLPVFNRSGEFVGLAVSSFGQSYLQFSRAVSGAPVILINVEESSAFTVAGEVLPYLGRVPQHASGRPLAWLGTYGLEPMDRDVAKFLKLSAQSGVVVSEVLEGSPAEQAGLEDRDIILALDGEPLPRLKPDRVIVTHIQREIDRRAPGQTLGLTVLRGSERIELAVVLGEQPKLMREAERKYFDTLGLTAREFVYSDGIAQRIKPAEAGGVIVHYVKPSSPVAIAGLRREDWLREIDGVEVETFPEAVEQLGRIERDETRSEFVLLVRRGAETAVLRVKLR